MWLILNCFFVVDLISDSIWIILVFSCKFCVFRIILFTLHIFNFFYPRINKPNIHNNIIGISSFQNWLNNLFSSTSLYFMIKVIEGSHKGENMFFNFLGTSENVYFWGCDTFFSFGGYPTNVILQWQYILIRFMFLMKHCSS